MDSVHSIFQDDTHSPIDDGQDKSVAKETEEKHEVVKDGQLSPHVVVNIPITWCDQSRHIIAVIIIVIIVCCRFHLHLDWKKSNMSDKYCIDLMG